MKRADKTKDAKVAVIDSNVALAVRTAEQPMEVLPLGDLAAWGKAKAITNDENYDAAVQAGTQISAILKKIEDERTELTAPLTELKKKLDGRARIMRTPFEQVRDHIKGLCADWFDKKRASEMKKAEKQAAKVMLQSPQAAADVLALAERANPVPAAGVRYTTKITGVVIDFAKLPDNYKLPDQKRIDAVIKAGGEIPGVSRKEETQVAMGSQSFNAYEG